MRRRGGIAGVAASPTMVGALTVMVVILAVFLAYNANTGLPFVPSYRLSAELPNADQLVPGNEVRIGGVRVGPDRGRSSPMPGRGRQRQRPPRPEARPRRRAAARRLDDHRPRALGARAQVPRDRPRAPPTEGYPAGRGDPAVAPRTPSRSRSTRC